MASGEASHWAVWTNGPMDAPEGTPEAESGPARLVGDRLVRGPAQPPAELDLPGLARRGVEAPGEYAAPIAHVALGRRRRDLQHFHLDVFVLGGRHLVLEENADRQLVA